MCANSDRFLHESSDIRSSAPSLSILIVGSVRFGVQSKQHTFGVLIFFIGILNPVEMVSGDQRTKLEEKKREILKEMEAVVIKNFRKERLRFLRCQTTYSLSLMNK